MGPLQSLESPYLTGWRRLQRPRDPGPTAQSALSSLFPPSRQHERMDLESVGDRLDFDAL
jgi:hypothetical protein